MQIYRNRLKMAVSFILWYSWMSIYHHEMMNWSLSIHKEKSHKHQSNRRFNLFTGLSYIILYLRIQLFHSYTPSASQSRLFEAYAYISCTLGRKQMLTSFALVFVPRYTIPCAVMAASKVSADLPGF